MKTKIKNCVFWVLGMSFLLLTGCSEEIYENHIHGGNVKIDNSISFKRFLNETNVKDFKNTKKFNSTNIDGAQSRLLGSEFYIDTTRIFRYSAPDNKVTYSFRAFPLSGTVEPHSYYNIVYEKIGTQWNEIIFLNKEKSNPTDARKLESSEMIYNRISGRPGFSEVITYSIQCDGSCTGACDGFGCPTGQCIKTTIKYIYTGIADTGGGFNGNPGDPGNGNTGSGGGGGNDYGGIFIPNPYSNSDDPLDPNFIYDGQISSFINSLALQNPNIASLLSSNLWLYPYINQFIRDNSGLNNSNKAAVQFALETLKPITLINMSNLTFSQIYQLYLDSFLLLLHNPTPIAANFVNQFALNCNIDQDVNLNFDDSWRSPANIDRLSITNNTPAGQKFNEVYEELMKSPQFKDLFTRMFGVVNFINVKFDIADIPQPSNLSQTQGTCQLFEYSNGKLNNKIIIDKSFLLNESNVEIARTIVHECIHAFLNVKLRHPSIGMTIANINNKDLAVCINENYNNFLNGTSHDFMIEKLIPTMVQILMEIKENLFTTTQIANAENPLISPIYQPNTTPPFGISQTIVTWNWNEYFRYLCYQGLEMTSEFQFMFPNPSAALSLYWQYIDRGNILFN